MAREHFHVLRRGEIRQRVRCRAKIEKAADLCCFFDPGVVVAVAVKNDALVRADRALDERVERAFKVVRLFELVGILAQRLRHGGIEHDIAARNGVGRADHAELKSVAGERERRCAVAVGRVAHKARQHVRAELHNDLFRAGIRGCPSRSRRAPP